MANLIKGYQKAATTPMLIGVDEEGGFVNRISMFPSFRAVPFKSPQELYKEGGFSLIVSDTKEKSQLLKSLGVNVNLAPVCDVSTNPSDFIYKRSFGKNALQTAQYVKAVVAQMNKQKIGCTLKHFPGYGNNVDTHTGIAIDKRSYNSFVKSDFIPFKAGITAGAGSVLVSHNIVESMDKKYPASLSVQVHTILREKLHFDGVIMTDDLSMDAIKDYTSTEEAAVLAIEAGNDLLIASDFDIQIPAVLAAVKNNKITTDRINNSVRRILTWKLSLGLIK
jgi:beta-N-acetylhexosaminidase